MEDLPDFVNTDNNGAVNGSRDSSGRFLPGNPGRPPGTARNKFRAEVKSYLRDGWPEFRQWISTLKTKEKVRVYLELLPYGLAKLSNATDDDTEQQNAIQKIDLNRLSASALKEVLAATKTTEYEP